MTYYVENIMLMKSEQLVSTEPCEFSELVTELLSHGYIPVKTALRRGNVKRTTNDLKNPSLFCVYSGRYGYGYCVHVNDEKYGYHIVIYYTKEA